MRALIVVIVLAALTSCANPEPRLPPAVPVSAQHRADTTPANAQPVSQGTTLPTNGTLPSGYSLTDTTEWGNMVEEGRRAVLRHSGVAIDTVDLIFGVAAVGKDSLIYLPVRTDTVPLPTSPTPAYESFPTEQVLWSPASHLKLREVLPFFDSYFSSPTITGDSMIVYWGIAPRNGTNGLYAMRYDFRTAHLDSLFLNRQDPLATDYRYHFRLPQMHGTEVAFDSVVLDASSWRIIRKAGRPPQ